MMKLYKYTGTISSLSTFPKKRPDALHHVEIMLHDFSDSDKAPTKVDAFGGLADYIEAIEFTDHEERYITADWYYDDLLHLYRIEIPSADPIRPAKVIAQIGALDPTAAVFGPADYIETSKPEPMTAEQFHEYLVFRSQH
jgi:hypothetical protein